MPATSRTVCLLALGGTIAMADQPGPEAAGPEARGPANDAGAIPRLAASDLVDAVPELADVGVELRVTDVRQMPSGALSVADIAHVAELIRELATAPEPPAGVVLTQGTDTIEETAWLLELLLDPILRPAGIPVAVTGAMRHTDQAGADGPANLLAAFRLVASPRAIGVGVVVVFGDDVHAARQVRKLHTSRVTAFGSVGGPIGQISEDRVTIWSWPVPLPAAVRSLLAALNPARINEFRVPVVPVTLADDGFLLRAVEAGVVAGEVDGLVVAGFGVGHVRPAAVAGLARLAATVPVLLASRIGAGPVTEATYGYPGSEADLLSRGLVRAGHLDPYKARILLGVLLVTGADRDRIAAAVEATGDYDS